ncbi:unnamed protein product [Caenorhabditis brenneri]
MDKSTRSKRRAPPPSEEKKEDHPASKAKKAPKNPPQGTPREETDEKEMLEKMDSESGMVEKVGMMEDLLPSIKRKPNKAMSDEDLERMFFALCGDDGKKYDSDDSILSDIDFMSAEEIAAKDRKFREVMEYIKNLPEQNKRLFQMARIGEETPEEREERRRVIREFQMEHMSRSEREKAEKKRLSEIKKADKRLSVVIDFFYRDKKKIKAIRNGPSLLTACQFSRCLELLADCVKKDEVSEDGKMDIVKTVNSIDVDLLNKRLNSALIGEFFCGDMTPAEYLKKKLRKIFRDKDILDVLDGHHYAFDFNTKDHIHALVNFYNDHKNVRKNLDIDIRRFVACAYYVARANDAKFSLNGKLKYAMFG